MDRLHRPLPQRANGPAHLQGVAVGGEGAQADEAAKGAEDGHEGEVEEEVPGPKDEKEGGVTQALHRGVARLCVVGEL